MNVRRTISIAALVLAGAMLFALGETLQYYFRAVLWGTPYSWFKGYTENFQTSLVLAALTPIAFVTSRRYRMERGLALRRVPIHVLAGLVFGVAGVSGIAGVLRLRNPELDFGLMLGKLGTFYALFYFALYWAIVAAIHAAHFYAESQSREEKLVRERLEVLRSKLNPHFLFNTLNAISTMALRRDHDGVVQGLGLVGDLLRAALDDSMPQEIPLTRELELTEKYLAVQRIRFGDRLRVDRSIDPRSLDALLPSMLLQPVVENAVVHGVASVPGDGWIAIETSVTGTHLHLVVSDSGKGFPSDPRNGIGIANTRERLQTMYGSLQTMELGNGRDGGARVAISIPLRREKS